MAEMAALGILILLSLLQTYTALDVFTPSTQTTFVTHDTVLNCSFSLDQQPMDLNFLAIMWSFQGRVVLRYDNRNVSFQGPRMSLGLDSIEKHRHAPLHISNVSISDGGIYKCTVIYSPKRKEKEMLLEVLARPQLSIPRTKIQRNTESTLTCMATGFFPPDIGMTWYKGNEVLSNQLMEKPQIYTDGTYQVKSTVTFPPTKDERHPNFSCRVQHKSLQETLQMDYQPTYEDSETSSNVVTVIIVILVLTTIAVGFGFFLWKKKFSKKAGMETFRVKGIKGPTKLIAGEETCLSCKVIKCPENISVTWLKMRGGQICEIPEFHGGNNEEEKFLGTQYGVISYRDGPNYTSSLRFRPSVIEHKDVTFICRYSYGKKKKEERYHCRAIYAKPQLLQPVSRKLFVSEELKYSVTLEKFYPRDITLRWAHGMGEPQEILPSTETFTDLPGGTYSVYSEVRVPEDLLKDPEFRVRVSWDHGSLDTSGYKDLSIRDSEYGWNPVVEEIQTPNIFHDTPVTLQCHISEYFPNAVTVKWLRRSENQELCEETDTMITSTITSRRETDNTYSCIASLTINPTLSVHQGAEYICRVYHPSLESPIEKKTKTLVVKAKPQMVEPIEITMGEYSRVHFTLNLQKFYPKDIKIDWRYEDKDKNYEMPWKHTPTKNNDLTHDITSVGHNPLNSFTDPQFKVHVTWQHESMEQPETRTLTIRDLPWRPQVGEIIIPKLEENKKVILTCNISGCFLNHLSVTWIKKEPGTDLNPIEIPLPNAGYEPSQDHKEKSYNSYLTFTYLSRKDQGADFICRVEQPNLEKPIERTTGPIGLDKPSVNGTDKTPNS